MSNQSDRIKMNQSEKERKKQILGFLNLKIEK